MPKWECVRISHVHDVSLLLVSPSGKIDLGWLVQLDSKLKRERWQDFDKYSFKSIDSKQAYWAVVDWLGSNGWEPFAVETAFGPSYLPPIWFRRSS